VPFIETPCVADQSVHYVGYNVVVQQKRLPSSNL